jgi:hypothetical protein
MIDVTKFAAAVDQAGGVVDITKIEFEVLENGAVRWILWDGEKRLFSCGLDREDLIEALQTSGVFLRMMMLALQEQPQ